MNSRDRDRDRPPSTPDSRRVFVRNEIESEPLAPLTQPQPNETPSTLGNIVRDAGTIVQSGMSARSNISATGSAVHAGAVSLEDAINGAGKAGTTVASKAAPHLNSRIPGLIGLGVGGVASLAQAISRGESSPTRFAGAFGEGVVETAVPGITSGFSNITGPGLTPLQRGLHALRTTTAAVMTIGLVFPPVALAGAIGNAAALVAEEVAADTNLIPGPGPITSGVRDIISIFDDDKSTAAVPANSDTGFVYTPSPRIAVTSEPLPPLNAKPSVAQLRAQQAAIETRPLPPLPPTQQKASTTRASSYQRDKHDVPTV